MDIEDIKRIGHTVYKNEENNTNFLCDIKTANIEYILLSEILENYTHPTRSADDIKKLKSFIESNEPGLFCSFGKKFNILSEEDFQLNNNELCICLITDIPYEVYLEIID